MDKQKNISSGIGKRGNVITDNLGIIILIAACLIVALIFIYILKDHIAGKLPNLFK